MGMDLGSGKGVRSEINVTPLVDVVLVLLIIFMVVTPLLQKGVAVDLPKAEHVASRRSQDPERPVEPIVLSVRADGTFWLGKETLTVEKLTEEVDVQHRAAPERHILVKGDRTVEFGKVRELLKILEKAGIQGASLAAAEIKEDGTEGGE